MNRIVIILILLGSLFCLSGCLEISYKSEVTAKLKNPFMKESSRPRIIDNGYLYSPKVIPALFTNTEPLDYYLQEKSIKPKSRGFKKFTKLEI